MCSFIIFQEGILNSPLPIPINWIGKLDGSLSRYVKLRVVHAPGMPGTFYPPPRVSDPDMHHGTCVTHVSWCMPGSLTSGFLWSRWRGKRSRHSWRMRNPQFCASGKRPMVDVSRAPTILGNVNKINQVFISLSSNCKHWHNTLLKTL